MQDMGDNRQLFLSAEPGKCLVDAPTRAGTDSGQRKLLHEKDLPSFGRFLPSPRMRNLKIAGDQLTIWAVCAAVSWS